MVDQSRRKIEKAGERRLGLHRGHRQLDCGLCGSREKLTKTHVPPQCAGNYGLVGRSAYMSNGESVRPGRKLAGGLWVYGLCKACNGKQAKHDLAYGKFASLLRPLWCRDWQMRLPARIELPAGDIRPGAISRSIVIGMFGLAPHLRTLYAELAAQLRDEVSLLTLPGKLALRLALARGERAFLAGPIAGTLLDGRRLNGRTIGFNTYAQVYFPPFAWHFITREPSLLDHQGWADVSGWLAYPPDEVVPLADFDLALPAVAYPRQHPVESDLWIEMFSDEITEILECQYLPKLDEHLYFPGAGVN